MSHTRDLPSQTHADARPGESAANDAALVPPVDVVEDSSGITLLADLPGVAKEALDVHVDGDTLTIEGRVDLKLPEGMSSTHAEVGLARYRRVFSLSRELDGEKVSAEFAHGVLTLRIPKAEHALPRRIPIAA